MRCVRVRLRWVYVREGAEGRLVGAVEVKLRCV